MSGFILITRHPSECRELQTLLDPCDLKLRPFPVLRVADVHDDDGWDEVVEKLPDLVSGGWLLLASPRAPKRFVGACRARRYEQLLDLPVAAVGPSTATAARISGLRVEVQGPGTAIGLARQLKDQIERPTTILFACGRDRRPELPQVLTEAGHDVVPVVVYRMDPTPPRELPPLGPSLDGVILTSPRAAELYLAGVGGLPLPCRHWALGPTTRDAAAALGIDCRVPPEPNFESLAEEICRN